MLTLFSPENFKTIPWKNGLGHTTELAISNGGTLDKFDWRLSIASVVNDGQFSNFAGYQRNLVLIEGEGLILDHGNGDVDELTNLLDIARFDGGNNTHGALVNGGIRDFNIMTNQRTFTPIVNCYLRQQSVTVKLTAGSLLFAYSLTDDIIISTSQNDELSVPVEHLIKYQPNSTSTNDHVADTTIFGKNMIVITLKVKACL
ncbi:HutD/Ves family protein [Colwellia psychrerythraea]|uniref:HutD-family protein n=1 Tax=Colwellia psychrerythraea TaxID=28229 RepID=A0A099KR51_COLPS|nr:HutD family protein [Colwellia psychrerythraea]KGJ92675.1 HutD-family protein [Colwellia psychrerythraea]